MLEGPRGEVGDALAQLTGPAVRRLLRPLSERGHLHPGPLEGGRRLVLVQLDGVSRRRLEWAFDHGHMPFLARRVEARRLALSTAPSGAPASTPAFQAGLFYGVAPSVPGFVWYDRRSDREIRMDRAIDAATVEEGFAQKSPPLLRNGTSYFSIFTGGAALPHFCLSGRAAEHPLDSLDELCDGFSPYDALASAIVHTVTAARTAGRLAYELAAGLWNGAVRSLSLGRLKHEPRFLLHRMLVSAIMRELAVQGMIIDIARGVPVMYADLLGFDEFAHRRGPDAPEAVEQLRSMDLAVAAIFAAAEAVPELGYDVYVLSDHGHVGTKPFQSFTGLSLPEYLALADGGVAVPRKLPRQEAIRLAQTRALRSLMAAWPNALDGAVGRGLDFVERRLIGHALGFAQRDHVVTAEAGDLAHVYFRGEREPLALDAIQARHPGVLASLAESRAVGMVAVRSGARGAALLSGRVIDLARPEQVALLPHPDPARLAAYLSDLVSLRDAGDLVVLGWRGEDSTPVAYAWEFGSHGGVAPEELEAFVLHPRDRELRCAASLRPDALYEQLHGMYRTPVRRRRSPPARVAALRVARDPANAPLEGEAGSL